MLQEIAFDDNGEIENNDTYGPFAWSDEAEARGWHISLNGQVMPTFKAHPGETQLLRFIHGGVRKNIELNIIDACNPSKPIRLTQIAADGISFTKKRVSNTGSVFMAPGYRSDVMIKFKKRGVYYLVDSADGWNMSLSEQYCDRKTDRLTLDNSAQNILARIEIEGKNVNGKYPKDNSLFSLNRPTPITDEELSPNVEYVEFDIDISVDPWVGLMNGKPYDPNIPRVLTLNTAQTWKISSVFSHHPFHIHVNPFEVIIRENGEIVDRYWKDTILVDQHDTELGINKTMELRMRYEDFEGEFVAHCHILDHEDHGMMEKIVIVP